jgi:hypothetical protein
MKYTKEYLTELVQKSKCIWDIVELAGINKQEGNFNYISKYLKKYSIDTSHFETQYGKSSKENPLDHYLVKGKFLTINGNRLKEKLFKAGLKNRFCELCGQNEIWRGVKISLILDHIDGDRNNNELSNFRVVCPNCNATLNTHCGKNKINNINREKV